MGHRYLDITFTDGVKAEQARQGSRESYAALTTGEDRNEVLGDREREFLGWRDSFYLATVSETGWPYVQHRGGPAGFVRVLDERTLGFADFRGNRQYQSVGNLLHDERVSLFFMDYPNRRRLKVLGRTRVAGADEADLLARLALPGYRADVERGMVISVAAFDWNCPQHITQRWTQEQITASVASLNEELATLRAENARLRALADPGARPRL